MVSASTITAFAILCMALVVIAYLMLTKMRQLQTQLAQQQKNHRQITPPQMPKPAKTQPPQPKLLQGHGLPATDSNMFRTFTARDLPKNLREMELHGAQQLHQGNLVSIDPQKIALQKGQNTYIHLVTETTEATHPSTDA